MNIREPWKGMMKPSRVWGNLYFVGGRSASVHIIDTGDGLILLDCGYQESLYLVLEDMRKLKLDPADIKDILITHGHIDHCGAAQALRRLYGCRLCIGAEDASYVNGSLPVDLTYAAEFKMQFIPFEPDVLLHNGDVIKRGNTAVRCIATPGHTKGAMSYFFDVTDGTRVLRAGLHGGLGMNTLSREYLDRYGLPYTLRTDFEKATNRLAEEHVDIPLGNHADQVGTAEKIDRVKNGEGDAFVDSSEWSSYVKRGIYNLEKLLQKENQQA